MLLSSKNFAKTFYLIVTSLRYLLKLLVNKKNTRFIFWLHYLTAVRIRNIQTQPLIMPWDFHLVPLSNTVFSLVSYFTFLASIPVYICLRLLRRKVEADVCLISSSVRCVYKRRMWVLVILCVFHEYMSAPIQEEVCTECL